MKVYEVKETCLWEVTRTHICNCTIPPLIEHYAMVQAFWQTSTSSSSNRGKYSSSRATLRQHTFFYFYFFFLMLERERDLVKGGGLDFDIYVSLEKVLWYYQRNTYISKRWSCWSQAKFPTKKTCSHFNMTIIHSFLIFGNPIITICNCILFCIYLLPVIMRI